MMARLRPVVAAFRARTTLYPFSEPLLEDVRPIVRSARLRIEPVPHVLKHGLFVAEVLARLSIELPQNAVLPYSEQQVLVAVIDEHALEHHVEIQRLGGGMLKM